MSSRTRTKQVICRYLIAQILIAPAVWIGVSADRAEAQGSNNSAHREVHPLASKEEMIRDRFERFLDRVFRLQEQLSENEPDNAVRLARVVERAGELGLTEQLDEILRVLRDSPSLANALDAQAKWVDDADQLLAILLQRDSDNEQREQQIERLEEYRQEVDRILEREKELRGRSDKAGRGEDGGSQEDQAGEPGEQDHQWDNQKEAEEQRDLADQTGQLADKIREDSESDRESRGLPQSGSQSDSSPPGAQSLDNSQQEMNDATEKLGGDKPGEAGESQDRALEELEQAQRELEEALNQLRQEDREETLRDLEGRFREMLSEQNAINAATVLLHEIGTQAFKRAEKLKLAELAAKERDLSHKASVCGHVLDEEGTTIVFPRVVEQLAEDMNSAAGRLAALNVGTITLDIEQEIVQTLEQLLEAVQKMQQENEQQQQADGGGGDDENQSLLPPSAELKLLRSSQVRINSRTVAIEDAKVKNTEPRDSIAGLAETTAARQAQCVQIARDMRDRQSQP